MPIDVQTDQDWAMLAGQGLDTVLDPMIARSGEVFLRGPAEGDAAAGWGLLGRNVHSVGMFFDAIVCENRIPLFNYGDTFDGRLNLDRRVLSAVNQSEPILSDVNVTWAPYQAAKSAALETLRQLYSGPAKIPRQAAQDILEELAAADYQWEPSLGTLERELQADDEKKLARFLLGGLVFGAYAQQLGGTHLVQPKRSRLFLAAALSADRATYRFEEELFQELRKRARASLDAHLGVTDLPWRPSFFPYLLSKGDSPSAVLTHALALRGSIEIKEYRAWLASAVAAWKRDGTVAPFAKDVKAIAAAVDRLLGTVPHAPKVELKVTLADVGALAAGIPKVPGAIDLTPALAGLWGFVLSSLPGKRHRKLLTRAIVADHDYALIENRLATVWRATE